MTSLSYDKTVIKTII